MTVTMYSTGCPLCKILKKKLLEKKITFEENTDIEKMLRLNFENVPILEVGDKRMEFNEAIKWIQEQE